MSLPLHLYAPLDMHLLSFLPLSQFPDNVSAPSQPLSVHVVPSINRHSAPLSCSNLATWGQQLATWGTNVAFSSNLDNYSRSLPFSSRNLILRRHHFFALGFSLTVCASLDHQQSLVPITPCIAFFIFFSLFPLFLFIFPLCWQDLILSTY